MQFFVYDPNFDPDNMGDLPTPEQMMEMGNFIAEAMAAGVVVATGALQTHGKRLTLSDGKFTVTDGPFIELKELLAGFAVLQADNIDVAIEWSKRFRSIIGDGTSEIVPLFDPEAMEHE